jgi:hypothetical protein
MPSVMLRCCMRALLPGRRCLVWARRLRAAALRRGFTTAPGALAAALLLSGCVYTGWPFKKAEPGTMEVPQRPDPKRAAATEGIGWKVVTGKREPHFLIARDGTECMVAKGTWEKTAVGSSILCLWGIIES